jgi:hypothetical protein
VGGLFLGAWGKEGKKAGLALKNPQKNQKNHLKKPTKMGFLGFFKFLIFYENNTNFFLSN